MKRFNDYSISSRDESSAPSNSDLYALINPQLSRLTPSPRVPALDAENMPLSSLDLTLPIYDQSKLKLRFALLENEIAKGHGSFAQYEGDLLDTLWAMDDNSSTALANERRFFTTVNGSEYESEKRNVEKWNKEHLQAANGEVFSPNEQSFVDRQNPTWKSVRSAMEVTNGLLDDSLTYRERMKNMFSSYDAQLSYEQRSYAEHAQRADRSSVFKGAEEISNIRYRDRYLTFLKSLPSPSVDKRSYCHLPEEL